MKIAVTGANGLVGSRLCASLATSEHQTLALGRGAKRFGADVPFSSVELSDEGAVMHALRDFKPDVIVNTASMTEVDACEKRPEDAFAANVTAAGNVARAARALDAHLLQLSTDYVFDGQEGPYDEDAIPNPRGVYSITKHIGEQAIRVLAPSWAIARTAVVYGWPPSARPNFGSWLVSSLRDGKQVKLFTDQFVSPSLALNVAAMTRELAERRLTGIWNVCGAAVIDRLSFGHALCEAFGFDKALVIPSTMAEVGLAAQRPPRSGLITAKAARALEAKPMALGESLAAFRREYEAAHPSV